MMLRFHHGNGRHWCWMLVALGACKPPEPTPSLYTDLGTEDQPLPPPALTWNDPSVAKGTAEWKPFRKPAGEKTAEAKPPSSTKPLPSDAEGKSDSPETEKELRIVVADFNTALAEDKLEDAANFLTDAQAEAASDVFAAVHALIEQLKALAAAAPGLVEKIDALAPLLHLGDVLKVEIQSVHIVDETHATAKLVGGGEAKFVVGDEDVWYFESPALAVLISQRERLETTAKSIEEALAKGTPDEATTSTLGKALDELRGALTAKTQAGDSSG